MTRTRIKKIISLTAKILLVVTILVALMIGVLKVAEKSKEPLRLGLQDYMTQASGHPAEITTLEQSKLFPDIEFLMKGIVIRDKDDKDKAKVTADSVFIALDFWKTFLGISEYRALEVNNAAFASGYLLPRKLVLMFAGISDPLTETSRPQFLLDGDYDGRPVLATIQIKRHGKGPYSYSLGDIFPVTVKIGDTEGSGAVERGSEGLNLNDVNLTSGGQTALFSGKNIRFDPLDVRLDGTVSDIPCLVTISRRQELIVVLVEPSSKDAESISKIKAFFDSIEKDLGLAEGAGNVKIEIKGTDVPPIETEKEEQGKSPR